MFFGVRDFRFALSRAGQVIGQDNFNERRSGPFVGAGRSRVRKWTRGSSFADSPTWSGKTGDYEALGRGDAVFLSAATYAPSARAARSPKWLDSIDLPVRGRLSGTIPANCSLIKDVRVH